MKATPFISPYEFQSPTSPVFIERAVVIDRLAANHTPLILISETIKSGEFYEAINDGGTLSIVRAAGFLALYHRISQVSFCTYVHPLPCLTSHFFFFLTLCWSSDAASRLRAKLHSHMRNLSQEFPKHSLTSVMKQSPCSHQIVFTNDLTPTSIINYIIYIRLLTKQIHKSWVESIDADIFNHVLNNDYCSHNAIIIFSSWIELIFCHSATVWWKCLWVQWHQIS